MLLVRTLTISSLPRIVTTMLIVITVPLLIMVHDSNIIAIIPVSIQNTLLLKLVITVLNDIIYLTVIYNINSSEMKIRPY